MLRRLEPRIIARALVLLALSVLSSACATVRPEQRAMLADPLMRFDEEADEQQARRHVLENREGSLGGGAVRGGGCGCN